MDFKSRIRSLRDLGGEPTVADVAEHLGCSEECALMVLERYLDEPGARVALVMADLHIPNHNEDALAYAIDEGIARGVTDVIILGDLIDCERVSSWPQRPVAPSMFEEITAARAVLDLIEAAFPAADKVIYEGNHEERIKQYLAKKAPEIRDLPGFTLGGALGITGTWRYVSVAELMCAGAVPPDLGGLYLLHGHEFNMSGKDSLERMHNKAQMPVLVAHRHVKLEYGTRRIDNTYMKSWGLPCMCNHAMPYSPLNDWTCGFAFVSYTYNSHTVEMRCIES